MRCNRHETKKLRKRVSSDFILRRTRFRRRQARTFRPTRFDLVSHPIKVRVASTGCQPDPKPTRNKSTGPPSIVIPKDEEGFVRQSKQESGTCKKRKKPTGSHVSIRTRSYRKGTMEASRCETFAIRLERRASIVGFDVRLPILQVGSYARENESIRKDVTDRQRERERRPFHSLRGSLGWSGIPGSTNVVNFGFGREASRIPRGFLCVDRGLGYQPWIHDLPSQRLDLLVRFVAVRYNPFHSFLDGATRPRPRFLRKGERTRTTRYRSLTRRRIDTSIPGRCTKDVFVFNFHAAPLSHVLRASLQSARMRVLSEVVETMHGVSTRFGFSFPGEVERRG